VTLRTYGDWEVATVTAQITLVIKSHAISFAKEKEKKRRYEKITSRFNK